MVRQEQMTSEAIEAVARESALHAEMLAESNFDLGKLETLMKNRVYWATKHAVIDTLETIRELIEEKR